MKNTLTDLNNHLFEQLEKLNDDELQGEKLEEEIRRSRAMSDIADMIIKNGELALKAVVKFDEAGIQQKREIPSMLESK